MRLNRASSQVTKAQKKSRVWTFSFFLSLGGKLHSQRVGGKGQHTPLMRPDASNSIRSRPKPESVDEPTRRAGPGPPIIKCACSFLATPVLPLGLCSLQPREVIGPVSRSQLSGLQHYVQPCYEAFTLTSPSVLIYRRLNVYIFPHICSPIHPRAFVDSCLPKSTAHSQLSPHAHTRTSPPLYCVH